MVFLVPLLLQLRRTAQAFEKLALDAQQDLRRITDDIHATRARMDEVAELAKRSLDTTTPMSQVITGVLRAVPAFLGQGGSQGPNIFEGFMTGLAGVVQWMRRAKPARKKEEEP
jgi:uncharacterized membrane protein